MCRSSFDLLPAPTKCSLWARAIFCTWGWHSLGNLARYRLGRVTYQTQANAHGTDSATLRVFDGISTTTLVISLDVRPVNDAPTAFVVEPVEVDESAVPGAVAGIATVFDVDSDARYEITTTIRDSLLSMVRSCSVKAMLWTTKRNRQ